MTLAHDFAYFWAGAFGTNAIPHAAAGLMGQPHRTPFANPPGRGLSSPQINVLWAFANIVIAWLLITRIGAFDPRSFEHLIALGLGALILGLLLARPRAAP